MLEIESLSRTFGDRLAIRIERLAVVRGETLVIMGASGSGKSTLLRVVAGLLRPDTGYVRLHGELLGPDCPRELRRRLGYVIQEGGLFPHLTARGNVTLLVRHLGWESSRIRARLDELVALTRFPPDALDRWPRRLSGGQRQRVSLMRALMHDPDLLLLDEPLGALDPLIRAELGRDLRRIFRALGKAVIFVTHDLAEARAFADRLVLVHEGRVVQIGTVRDLEERPATPFVTEFLGAQTFREGVA
ncbi:MAG: ATP-binding cassette domain-containing protein [Gemmatimonadetes bacterium]|nr:ATP-binding cassette domain-containing protein [Gemmatimonadota bacterium]